MTLKASLQKGLVLHMSLDQESYNPATKRFTDKTPYSNHGTSYNTATFTTDHMGQPNQAMSFNGTDDFIDCGNDESLNITDAITIEVWVKETERMAFAKVFAFLDIHAQYGYFLGVDNGHPYGGFENAGVWITSKDFTIPLNEWHHIVWTFSDANDEMKIYANGVLKETLTETHSIAIGTNLGAISKNGNCNTGYFNGIIDEVRVYNRVLSADEITALYEQYRPKVMLNSLDRGLVLNMSLDQQSYNPATKRFTDKTPYSNNGTSYNDATFTTDRMGQPNRAMLFNGTDDYVDCGNDESLNITDAITIEAWVKPTSISGDMYILSKRDDSNNSGNGFGIWYNQSDDNTIFWIYSSGYKEAKISSVLSVKEWTHITGIADGSNVSIYINGILKNSISAGVISSSNGDLIMGARYNLIEQFFNGIIDEVRVYNRVLSADEITALYEMYRPKILI